MRNEPRVAIQRLQMAALERISRTRALTAWESTELERLHYAAQRRAIADHHRSQSERKTA